MMLKRSLCLLSLVVLSSATLAYQTYRSDTPATLAASGEITVAFTPGQDAAGLIIAAINEAQQQVLVQAFSFTHKEIAQALIQAHQRGVEVKLLADREQTRRMPWGQVAAIAAAGVPVWLDGQHQSAHDKVMVIDADGSSPIVITGSYNFTKAAQHKNSENLLIMRGNLALTEAYQLNWQTHLQHGQPFGGDVRQLQKTN